MFCTRSYDIQNLDLKVSQIVSWCNLALVFLFSFTNSSK